MNLTLEKENVNTFNGTKTDIIDETEMRRLVTCF